MKHTECKDCEFSNGDCCYHFEMDGVTNFDIPSLSACDKYGNCMFFKAKAGPKGDTISREALKAYTREVLCGDNPTNPVLIRMFDEIIDNTPTVEEKSYAMGYQDGIEDGLDGIRQKGKWVVKSNGTTNYYACDKCGSAGDIQDKFCRECGADMRKGGAK